MFRTTSEPFAEPRALVGAVAATLFVGSDAVDTDFHAKLTDVYPDGQSRLLQDSAVRMRWRGVGFAPDAAPHPAPDMVAGEVYEVGGVI